MNLGELVSRSAQIYGGRTAVVDGERTITYGEVNERANRFANAMRDAGFSPGDRVALLVGNRLEWFDATFGVAKAGLVRTYINPRSAAPEIAYQLADAGCRGLVVSPQDAVLLEGADLGPVEVIWRTGPDYEAMLAGASPAPPEVSPGRDDLLAIQYSSGTTGRPKGVMQTHGNWLAGTSCLLTELQVEEHDAVLHVGPMSHGSGAFALPLMYRGARQVIFSGFDPEAMLEAIPRHRITTLFLVPTMIYMLLEKVATMDVDASSLRLMLYGGSPMAPGKLEQCLERFGPIFVQGYALTEQVGLATRLASTEHIPGSRRLGSAGRPAMTVDLAVVDEEGKALPPGEVGEIVLRGPQVMKGYWNQPDATADVLRPDGTLRTSDMGYLDEEGYLFIIDRKTDMIVSGGFNVYPREVEDVLLRHPDVAEAAVVSAPDEVWGEQVRAVVRTMPGSAVTAELLDAFVRTQLSGYKVPRSYDFQAEPLPKNPNGKVLRRSLRDRYWSGAARPG